MNEREQISALVDGELPPAERDALVRRMTAKALGTESTDSVPKVSLK